MKGVSSIIAIILILMIVVALAALAYTWFTQIFSGLTTSATNATTTATTAMGMQFRIEVARNITGLPACNISVTIRNIGTTEINPTRMTAYVNDVKYDIKGQQSALVPYGNTSTFNVSMDSPCNPKNSKLKLVTETGLEQTTTVT